MDPIIEKSLRHLDWHTLLERIAVYAQTDEGRQRATELRPNLKHEEIVERWETLLPLQTLARKNYAVPVGELPTIKPLARAARLGQMVTGPDLLDVQKLLEATRSVHSFCQNFRQTCSPLHRFFASLQPMPTLLQQIDSAIQAPEGTLLDTASDDLDKLRKQKRSLRTRIEKRIQEILREQELEKYLQDDFFTVRNDRYVVPIRLDGRGRVQGVIIDTSESGQTLFIEPHAIVSLNQELLELDLSEKLEIIRIFRDFSQKVAEVSDTLVNNYEELVEIDFLSCLARASNDWDGAAITIDDSRPLQLFSAIHPLIKREDGATAIPNDILLDGAQRTLIISGPNAGGKTVVLKTVGLCQLMLKAGLPVPVDQRSSTPLFDQIFTELGDAQSLTANLSTFSAHLYGLKPILQRATEKDLVLLDELATGTEPQTGSALAQAILEDLTGRNPCTLVTTHFDALKGLAVQDARFRNGSMEFSLKNRRPTYRLVLDVPGQSFGLEVAEEIGLPAKLIERARGLRGESAFALDEAVAKLSETRENLEAERRQIQTREIELAGERERWQREVEAIRQTRTEVKQNLKEQFGKTVSRYSGELEGVLEEMRSRLKTLRKEAAASGAPLSQELAALRDQSRALLHSLSEAIDDLAADERDASSADDQPIDFSRLKIGDQVFMKSIAQWGEITALTGLGQPLEVQVGIAKLRVALGELTLKAKDGGKKKREGVGALPQGKKSSPRSTDTSAERIPPTFETPTNTLDLRGMDGHDALKALWQFLDRAVMRGESSLIVLHGHGTERLKTSVRQALKTDCPYQLVFRPGEPPEGGDGVTVLKLL